LRRRVLLGAGTNERKKRGVCNHSGFWGGRKKGRPKKREKKSNALLGRREKKRDHSILTFLGRGKDGTPKGGSRQHNKWRMYKFSFARTKKGKRSRTEKGKN